MGYIFQIINVVIFFIPVFMIYFQFRIANK